MSKIDWDRPLEAYHEDGRVVSTTVEFEDGAVEGLTTACLGGGGRWFDRNGLAVYPIHGWRIRNVTEPKADIEAWAIKRAEELSGCNFYGDFGGVGGAFARYIMTKEEVPVDPDEAIADELLRLDATTRVIILRAIKRGRELERGEVK